MALRNCFHLLTFSNSQCLRCWKVIPLGILAYGVGSPTDVVALIIAYRLIYNVTPYTKINWFVLTSRTNKIQIEFATREKLGTCLLDLKDAGRRSWTLHAWFRIWRVEGCRDVVTRSNRASISLVNLLNNEIAWAETQYLAKAEW